VRGAQRVQLGQLRPKAGIAGGRSAGDERLGDRTERAELFLGNRFRAYRPPWCRPWAAVMRIQDRDFTRRDQHVFGYQHALTGTSHDRQCPVEFDMQPHLLTDQTHRYREAMTGERLVRDRQRGSAPGQEAAAEVGL
jgi:hypothetical protein